MKYGIGIDVGGTRIKYCISDRNSKIVYNNIIDTEYKNPEQFLEKISLIISECLRHSTENNRIIAGISVAFPGVVENGVVTGGAGNLPGIAPLPLTSFLEKKFNLPSIAMNDATAMAMGEHYFGAARDCTDGIFVTVGTGIGGGILVDGKFYNGYKERGGELGHIVIERDGLPCSCGSRGCFEVYGSTSALVRYYSNLSREPNDSINGHELFQKFIIGDTEAIQAFEWHFKNIAIGLGSLANIFSPELIVLGGGIVNSGPEYLNGIRQYLEGYMMEHIFTTLRIAPAMLGDSSACVGGVGHLFSNIV